MKHRPGSWRLPAALLVLLLWPLSGCQSSVLEVGSRKQFFIMEVMLYEGIRLGFTTVFAHGSREDQPLDRGSIQLTYSRDGRRWERWKGRVFLPVSEQPGDFDWGMVYMAQAPVVVGDEIYLYYAGHGHDHRHHLPPGVRQERGRLEPVGNWQASPAPDDYPRGSCLCRRWPSTSPCNLAGGEASK